MKNLLIATTALVALSAGSAAVGSAVAADIGARPYMKAPGAAPSYDWSGFYLGATAGGGLENTTIDDKDCNLSCSSLGMSKAFATVGGTAGYNYQFGPGVLGIEGDINWTSYKSTLTDPDFSSPAGTFHSAKSDWFATVRGRFGLAVDRVLVYGTGGVAFVDRKVSGNSIDGTCPNSCFAIDEITIGVVAGVGAEYAFAGPWSAKIEYLHVMTPTKRAFDLNPERALFTFNQYAATTSMDIVRAGINYRFGGPDAAKY